MQTNEIRYATVYDNALGMPCIVGGSGQSMERLVDARWDMKFGAYNPRGGGTTIAHLAWQEDGSCTLEGMTGTIILAKTKAKGEVTDAAGITALVLTYWPVFTAAEERRHRAEQAYKSANPEPFWPGACDTRYEANGVEYAMSKRGHLIEAIERREPLFFGPYSGATKLAWMVWKERNVEMHRSDRTHVLAIGSAEAIADDWKVFTQEAYEEASAMFEVTKQDWEAGLAQAVS
jgi:hypothetical protein